MLDDLGFMEKQGRGIPTMKKLMLDHGLKEPTILVTDNFVKLTLYGPEGDLLDLAKISATEIDLSKLNLNERQIEILNYLEKHGSVSTKEYCSHFPTITKRQALRDLKNLLQKGLVALKGKGPARRYIKG